MAQAIISKGNEDGVDTLRSQFRKHNLFIAQYGYSAHGLPLATGVQASNHLVATAAEKVDDDLGVATGTDYRHAAHADSPGAASSGNALPARHNRMLELTWSRSWEKSAIGRQAPVRSSMRYSE